MPVRPERICPALKMIEVMAATADRRSVIREEGLCLREGCEWWEPNMAECSVRMLGTGLRCALVEKPDGGMAILAEVRMTTRNGPGTAVVVTDDLRKKGDKR